MRKDIINKKCFIHKGQTLYYLVKDIEFKEVRGKEMAKAIMMIRNESDTKNYTFAIYDEKDKVLYSMPDDALRWYEEHTND